MDYEYRLREDLFRSVFQSTQDGTLELPLQAYAGAPTLVTTEPSHQVLSHTKAESSRGYNIDDRLTELFDRAKTHNQRQYTDTEIHRIQSLLGYLNRSWSRVPRTYIVLRHAGHIDLLDSLIEHGFSDYWFPVSAPILPDILSPVAKANILDAQNLILTKLTTFEKGKDGQHACFGPGEDLPFETMAILGRGVSGVVEKVLSSISFREYALKRIRRKTYFRGAASSMEACITELEVLRRLEHKHIVDFVGSYTDPEFIGLLMSPVADCNLAKYFELIPSSEDRQSLLRSFFGCLATALAYLHESRVRHKDIKPQNILIKGGNVLLADFGLARDSLELTCSMSDGASGFSPRYCAPEVAAFEPRDSSSDIWSLGCVFLEMVSVLKGWSVTEMQNRLKQYGSRSSYVRCNENGTSHLIATLRDRGEIHDNLPLDWIETMLALDRSLRPTARSLASRIESAHRLLDAKITFCGICCMTGYGEVNLEGDSDMTDMDESASTPLPQLYTTKKRRKISREAADKRRNQVHSSPARNQSASRKRKSKQQQAPPALRSSSSLSPTVDAGDLSSCSSGSWTLNEPRGMTLINATEKGDSDVVGQLLRNHANPTTMDNFGWTPLHYACRDGHIGIASTLLDFGANLYAVEFQGRTVLSLGAIRGQHEVVSWLLARGMHPDEQDSRGISPLSYAASYGRVEVVRILLRRSDVDPNSTDDLWRTSLSYAAELGHSEPISLLLAQPDLDLEKIDKSGYTALDYAVKFKRKTAIRLLKEAESNHKNVAVLKAL